MNSYNILDRHTPIDQACLLEASAGTGKTFTIEHLVTRFILEKTPVLRIPQILVVTFTRAATRDLKVRVRACLKKSIHLLKTPSLAHEAPDYLKALIERGPEVAQNACRLLDDALFYFDDAQIFTIHLFCARSLKENALEANLTLGLFAEEAAASPEIIKNIIRDFFQSGQAIQLLGAEPLKTLWEKYHKKYAELEAELAKEIAKKTQISAPAHLENIAEIFASVAHHCQSLVRRRLHDEEAFGPDELQEAMVQAVRNPAFCERLRQKYHAVIIDEFQDTDPGQWTIFERIFLSGQGPTIPIYLVGDPKQSIYAFRQADIYTYLKAGDALGLRATLDTNYRSQPSLIKALNTLFVASHAPNLMPLPRLGADLPYREVKAGNKCPQKVFNDDLGDVSFLFFPDKAKSFDPLWHYIASQIQRLHTHEGISYKEIAVLMSSRYQGEEITQFFKPYGIPVANQRVSILAGSPVLKDWKAILLAAINPRSHSAIKEAMGSPLIGWTHDELIQLEDSDRLIALLAQWQQLKKDLLQGVGVFMTRFIVQQWSENGLSVVERLVGFDGGQELYEDFLQIGEYLLEHQTQTLAQGIGLIKALDAMEDEDSANDEKLKMRHDPSKDAVNLLTTFASKGLEYDIVFAPGLMHEKSNKDVLITVYKHNQMVREPTMAGSEAHKQYLDEIDAEKMRQLYVAMTRARYRVYLPAAWGPAKLSKGSASPISLFLARLGQPAADADELYRRINAGLQEPIEKFFKSLDSDARITYQTLDIHDLSIEISADAAIPHRLLPPPIMDIPQQHLYMHSFTSLAKKMPAICSEAPLKADPPHDFQCSERTPHTLPSGSDTGNLLHALIETIPLELVRKNISAQGLLPWVRNRVQGTPYQGWEECLAQILYQTFNTPLVGPHEPFVLAEIEPKHWFREMEFLYPAHDGFLKGKIDCVVQHQGCTYILDWKSNWLGPGEEFYTEPSLQRAMLENFYDLQAEIYAEAWRRYCRHLDPANQDDNFGGTFYLFLRGPGVYYCHPQEELVCKD